MEEAEDALLGRLFGGLAEVGERVRRVGVLRELRFERTRVDEEELDVLRETAFR